MHKPPSKQLPTFLKEGKFTGLGIDSFAAEELGPERPLCMQLRQLYSRKCLDPPHNSTNNPESQQVHAGKSFRFIHSFWCSTC